MGIKKEYWILAAIFLLALGVRLFFAFQTSQFSDSMSYFNLRQIESIRKTGFPIFDDPLSYSGRFYVFLPLFHYVIALFSLVLPLNLAVSLIPNILISLLVVVVFFITLEMTKNTEASLVAAGISGFLPILFLNTVTTISVYTLVMPLSFAILLALMRVAPNSKSIALFMILMILMVLTDLSVIVLLFGFFVYLFLGWLVKLGQERTDLELIYASSLVVILFSFLIFKGLFITYGPDVIRQNIPQVLLNQYFASFNIFEAIYQIGIIPFVFGIYVIYKHLFVEKDRNLYIIISFALSLSFLIWMGMIELKVGMIFFSIVLAILSGEAYRMFSEYLKKTKLVKYYAIFISVFIIFALLTSFLPSLLYAKLSVANEIGENEILALEWLKGNTPENSVVAGSTAAGHLITAIANRKDIMDTNYLMQENAEQRLLDLNTIYTTRFQTDAVKLLNKYGASYILFSDQERDYYKIPDLSYVNEGNCFNLVYDKGAKIYQAVCVIEEGK
jgi:hypothetical protein